MIERLAATTGMTLLVVALAACDRSDPVTPGEPLGRAVESIANEPGRPSVAERGYVDDETCKACHADVFRTYAHVGMSHTFRPADAVDIIESFEENNHFYHDLSDRHYEMFRRDERIVVSRYQIDEAGQRINSYEQEVDFVIGSGHHARSYLTHMPSGELYETPIVWYADAGQWGMAPGFDRWDHLGFNREVDRGCIFCHAAFPDMPAGSDIFGHPYVYPADMRPGLGCQRCHGPGREHVELAADPDATSETLIASIINPENLEPALRDDTCNQCHLQPSSRGASLLHRFDRGTFTYTPGEPLQDFVALMDFEDDQAQEDRFEVNHHAYRMRQSPCFLETEGTPDTLSCLTCHDAHVRIEPADVLPYYREKCFSCHAMDDCTVESMGVDDPHDADCMSCHMPKRRPIDATGSIVTDHNIRRFLPEGDLTQPSRLRQPPLGGPASSYADALAGDPNRRIYELIAELKSGILVEPTELVDAVVFANPRQTDPWLFAADVLHASEQHEYAIKMYRRALEKREDFAYAHLGIGRAQQSLGQIDEAITSFERAVELEPWFPAGWERLGVLHMQRGDLDEAERCLRKGLSLRPNFAEAHYELGELAILRHDPSAAVVSMQQAVAIDPSLAEAYLRLGETLRLLGQHDEAVRWWRHGTRNAPMDARLPALAALNYVMNSEATDFVEALRFARLAVDRDVESGDAHFALALAALVNQNLETARVAATTAERLGADPVPCRLVGAVTRHVDGKTAEARRMYDEVRELIGETPPTDPLRAYMMRVAGRFFGSG